ncbi:MAG: adenylate kinase [Parabacteroides sp.]|nr:adenylate kinase [Parabacteroides sp.]
MIILIAGGTHTGKTLFAQRLLEKYKYPYLSIDHLKMGLIRSGQTSLSPESPNSILTDFLWPVVREIIKTCVENGQNLIVEGCYIPFGWEKDFTDDCLRDIKYICLIFSEEYIRKHFADIVKNESVIEKRLSTDIAADDMIKSNVYNLEQCKLRNYNYILIDRAYQINVDII